MATQPEPPFVHGRAPRCAVLLCNLGTPEAPSAAALRRYLAEFLSDPRVVEIPRLLWWPILHGIILPFRPAKSAAKYARIWGPQGSPLKVWSQTQATLLHGYLGERGHQVQVRYAMRYGQPSIASVLDELKAQGVTRVLIVPAYPQYSGSTSASVFDAVARWGLQIRHLPELRFINRYHDDPGYIAALAKKVRAHWLQHGPGELLLMSFHGVPRRTLELGDPYHCECLKTARLLAEKLGLPPDRYQVTFQSRFGRAEWLQPYTEPTLVALAQRGVKKVDLVCPGFICDCLETLEEIKLEARATFLQAGGEQFHYIDCLNDSPDWLRALTDLCERHLQGWPTRQADDPMELQASRQRALALGAPD
ncbi:ferrochelatase [Hydrogenophaga sp.]|uniref:ferrochelatase n=1 Tax=Hydrogenophaga sp. TaxID=1904254 RepID=UPI0019B9E496|nr:ferrochelatase [Hydrogenophaga sp.]MBD3893609.1 ferrochelatase [Hydrogenophaga sp.]